MWVTKLLISPLKIRICCLRTTKFDPKMASLFILGQALPAHLVPCWWVGWWFWYHHPSLTLALTLININKDKKSNIRLDPMKMKQECAFCFDLDPLKCTSLPLTHISFEKCINRAATLLKIVELETLQCVE